VECSTVKAALDRAWPVVRAKADLLQGQFLGAPALPTSYPQVTTTSGQYAPTDASQWTAGFLSAIFSQTAVLARRQAPGTASKYRALGTWAASNLGVGVNALGNHHDVGFLIYTPYRAAAAVGHPSPLLRRQVLKAAAARFKLFQPRLGRFGGFPTGKKSLPDPPNDVMTIVDDMVNLELMFGTAGLAGRCDWFRAAAAHARSMTAGHVERNGSVHHKVKGFYPGIPSIRKKKQGLVF